jgi:CRP/FNR family transcriptional regulator, nitrogen fixation regulation protein
MREMLIETHQSGPAGAPVGADGAFALGPVQLQGVRMRFKRNEEVFGEGERAEHVYRVMSGAVRTIRFSTDGRRQIVAFHLPGDVFGLERNAEHSFSAEALIDSDVLLLRRSLIDKAAAESVAAAQALLQLSAGLLHEAQEHALVLGRKGAGERVAAFILKLAERCNTGRELELPMSRADIADYLALTIETVSRAFTQMERDRAIALPSSRHVVVKSRMALEELQAA